MGKREILDEFGEQSERSFIVFEDPSYENAIIGITDDDRVVYSYDRMVQCLIDEDGMEEEDAIEFIDYNTIRAIPYFGEKAPIVVMMEDLFNE